MCNNRKNMKKGLNEDNVEENRLSMHIKRIWR